MDRAVEKIGESHDRQVLTMNSTSDYAGWARTFPDPPLTTHVIGYHWRQKPGGPKELVIEPVLAETAPARAAKDAPPDPADGHAPVRAKLIEELNKLDLPNLQTKAAENGLELTGKEKKPQIVATIADKLAPRPV